MKPVKYSFNHPFFGAKNHGILRRAVAMFPVRSDPLKRNEYDHRPMQFYLVQIELHWSVVIFISDAKKAGRNETKMDTLELMLILILIFNDLDMCHLIMNKVGYPCLNRTLMILNSLIHHSIHHSSAKISKGLSISRSGQSAGGRPSGDVGLKTQQRHRKWTPAQGHGLQPGGVRSLEKSWVALGYFPKMFDQRLCPNGPGSRAGPQFADLPRKMR